MDFLLKATLRITKECNQQSNIVCDISNEESEPAAIESMTQKTMNPRISAHH